MIKCGHVLQWLLANVRLHVIDDEWNVFENLNNELVVCSDQRLHARIILQLLHKLLVPWVGRRGRRGWRKGGMWDGRQRDVNQAHDDAWNRLRRWVAYTHFIATSRSASNSGLSVSSIAIGPTLSSSIMKSLATLKRRSNGNNCEEKLFQACSIFEANQQRHK